MRRFRIRDREGNPHVFCVDDHDADLVRAHKWRVCLHLSGSFYLVRSEGRRTIPLHREIMGDPPGMLVDHADRDTLNNCRSNLRVCTAGQNQANRKANRTHAGLSRFKGVRWQADRSKWRARIRAHPKRISLGLFDSEEEAARAYDRAAIERWGDFACTNEMLGLYTGVSA